MSVIAIPQEPLTDGVVILRPWHLDDVTPLAAAVQHPDIPRWTFVPSPYTEKDAHEWIAAQPRCAARGESVSLAVALPHDGDPIGSVGLPRLTWEHGRGEVGYWLAAHARGRGLMTRSVRILAAWAFGDLGLRRLDLLASTENHASHRVAEGAGFRREGLLRSFLVGSDGPFDAVMYSRLRDDPPT
jgi:RimJ/RimL family protein N-acetyltransferase